MRRRLADAWQAVRRPTLRRRMTLWTSLLLILTAGLLVAFLTVATTFGARRVVLRYSTAASGSAATQELRRKLEALVPGSPPPGQGQPLGLALGTTGQGGDQQARVRYLLFKSSAEAVLAKIRLFSLIGLGLVIVLGVLTTYRLTGVMLRPLQQLGRRMRDIDSHSLTTRLPTSGPDDELRALTDTFNHMLERLDRAFQQQRTFASDSAHELRTPLAILRTNLEVVHADPNATIHDYRATARVLERTVARLEHLVADLLLLSHTEQLRADDSVVLGPLLEDIRTDLASVAADHGAHVAITGDLDATVGGDATLLKQAFSNLLENAIRYNRPGGDVTAAVGAGTDSITVDITDQGPGIPETDVTRVFDRFYRIDRSRSRHAGGTGLGLAIVKHIVEQHHGTIEITHTSPEGTTFTVHLPVEHQG